jgi:prepilin-type N-terminal cleavage/methylation domain-containing protein/prepilin-type processing-associated H-X9-DG protein
MKSFENSIERSASSPPPAGGSWSGFTLVELLVVLALTVILAALLLPALTNGRTKAKRVACIHNMRQVGFALSLYAADFVGRLPNPKATNTFDFNNATAPDNPLKQLRPFVGLTDPAAAAPVYICPGARPTTKPAYAPVGISSTALMFNQVVMNRRQERVARPAQTVVVQENYALMGYLWYQPANAESDPSGPGRHYTRWHMWTSSGDQQWSGTKREHYCDVHQRGGNLVWGDGHASYKLHAATTSLDWGLVDSAGLESAWVPTLAHSCDIYTYR